MRRILLALGAVGLIGALTIPGPTAGAQSGAPAVHFLVDVSGSMSGAKIAEARSALLEVGGSIPSGTDVGLRAFAGSCTSPGTLRVPVGPYDDSTFASAVDGLIANGGTPTSAALRLAVQDFPAAATSRTLVLIADGDDQCGDLCTTVRELVSQGVDVTVQAVGIQVGTTAEAALTCAAQATGGEYFSVGQS